MKKRTAFIGAILSLIPLGQPLFIKTGFFLSTTGIIISHTEKVFAKSQEFFFDRGKSKHKTNDYEGAIEDFTKAIELGENDPVIYYLRGMSRRLTEDSKGACKDWKKAAELGDKDSEELLKKYCS